MTTQCPQSAIDRLRVQLAGRPIVLVGLMGAGKSAIGRKLAARLGLAFVDADREIEKAASMPIPEIFANYGEPEFRRLEASVTARLLAAEKTVLATGGGAFMNPETRRNIADAAVSVWLCADLDLLMSRVSRKPTRPLLQDDDPRGVMERLMRERYPVYAQADVTVQSRDIGKEQMAETVIAALCSHLQERQSADVTQR
ncbi:MULTISPECIES: shikimate kinase [unclassified Roseitalea]|uniref:shikimate kinase n=1 Tax=unclassified Roseitalea TaxID=2639107 RepID=UPI00273DED54|nr:MULTISPECIES: shikimate kinase [unclassified Roseitalea]